MSAPDDVTPREAAERWLSKRAVECADSTLSTYWYRIKKIVDYCEANDIERLQDLSPWELDEFDAEFRGRGPVRVTISKEYRTMNNWLDWAENIGIAQDSVSAVLDPPETTKADEVSEDRLEPDLATATLREFRSQRVGGHRATLQHTLLELEWWTGARIAAIRGIDREDVDLDEGTIEFHHRPETETPIKQAHNPERKVGLQEPVVDVLRDYVDRVRNAGVTDDYRRSPLLTSETGRLSPSHAQRHSYFASLPCQSGPCPHDRDPTSCEWMALRPSYQCPSARGPHAIRSGGISNLLNSGWHLDEVAERVNTGPKRLVDHYDFPTMDEQYRERRADLVDRLRLDQDDGPDEDDDPRGDTDR